MGEEAEEGKRRNHDKMGNFKQVLEDTAHGFEITTASGYTLDSPTARLEKTTVPGVSNPSPVISLRKPF